MYKHPYHNNLFFGDRSKLVKKPKPVKTRAANAVDVNVRLYIAQHNFVDTEPSAIAGNTRLPILPGQAVSNEWSPAPSTPLPTPVFADFTVGSGDTFEDVLYAAEAAGLISNLSIVQWDAVAFLQSFVRAGHTFALTRTNAFLLAQDNRWGDSTQTDSQLNPVNAIWTGWSPLYFAGIHRPARFENYPVNAINQYYIYEPIDGSTLEFTLDFAKTQSIFEDPAIDPELPPITVWPIPGNK